MQLNKLFNHSMEEVMKMGRGNKYSVDICMEDGDQVIPYLHIDCDGENKVVTWLVSEDDRKKYEHKMLKNIGESMSRYYAAHPERLH